MDKNSFKNLRAYATNLIFIGSSLLKTIDSLEEKCTDDYVPPDRKTLSVKAAYELRKRVLNGKYKTSMDEKEYKLWLKLIKDVDCPGPYIDIEKQIHENALNSLNHEDYC